MTKSTLLVVDDESDNLDALERIFRKRYHFLRASSGSEAISIMRETPEVDVIITDQRMPGMTGVELLERTLSSHPKTVRILLTGYTEIDSIIAAVNQGHIFRYITKPWDTTDLTNSVEQAMEHFARGRELEIKNRDLEKALSELKQLDQLKSKFMILINHELKTPLTVISSFLSLLLETRLDQDQLTYLDRVQKSTARLQEIIDDTLILTQHEAGALKPKVQKTSMFELIQQTLQEFQQDATKKNLTIQLPPLVPSEAVATVDPVLIKRTLRHLLGNAIRFSPNNTVIMVEMLATSNQLEVIIENEGSPIPQDLITKLHTPFNLQTEIMNHSKGLGLGLSVADTILKSHGGQLKLENRSIPNQPAHVRVSFAVSL
jgi:two-component system sensor histidine kinase/response regulator